MQALTLLMFRVWLGVTERPRRRGHETGDVPGWVMITILSAILVVGLIGIAGPKLDDMFNNATSGVATKTP